MPMLQVNVLTGYTDDIKQRLCQELTKTVSGVVERPLPLYQKVRCNHKCLL
jgi:phenylpyruvate tautomerase PptA (4-oxalocrotonate tautomerase family)